MKALSIAGYLGMMVGLLALIYLHALFSKSPVVIAVQVVAFLFFLWARITFGRRSFHVAANPTEGGLVTTGPYRLVRHPIYTALCVFTGVGAAAHLSWKSALAFATIFAFAIIRIFCEETLVRTRYPEYEQYADKTWRMIPGIF